jgi:hypothetical protein
MLIRRLFLIALVFSVSACSSFGGNPAERLAGEWRTEVAGFRVTVVYSDDTVRVGQSEPVPYVLEGDRLSFVDGGSQVRILSFPSRDEMVQTDPMTGTQHAFVRL